MYGVLGCISISSLRSDVSVDLISAFEMWTGIEKVVCQLTLRLHPLSWRCTRPRSLHSHSVAELAFVLPLYLWQLCHSSPSASLTIVGTVQPSSAASVKLFPTLSASSAGKP